MKLSEDSIIEITDVEHVSGLKLRIKFNDCNERLIAFEPFVEPLDTLKIESL